MDLDAFAALHAGEWDRLETLAKSRRLSGAQADELVALYSQVATHLSQVRSAAPDPALVARLSTLLARARVTLSGAIEPTWRAVARFFAVVLPVALWRIRWWSVAVAAGFCLVAALAGWWVATHPEAQGIIGTPNELRRLAEHEFADYYSQDTRATFSLGVWTNNAWVAAQCLAMGITGVWPLYMLWSNAINVGAQGGVMVAYGHADVFFGLLLPHGLLELSCIWVAAAAGLRLFWAWVVPGPVPRSQALAREGRIGFTIALGLALALGVSGLIEGFVTPSGLPGWAKLAIGAGACVAFWAWFWVVGSRQTRRGQSADLLAGEGADAVPIAG